MIGPAFINRENELAFFRQQLAATSPERNRVMFLAAPTGFGKSEFTERLINEVLHSVAVKVRIPANAEGDTPYLRELASELDRIGASHESVLTGDDFLRGVKTPRTRKMHDSALLSDAGATGIGIRILPALARIHDRRANIGIYDFQQLLRDNSSPALLKIFEYVRYVFAQRSFCLAVENIQAIDPGSERMLADVLAQQRGHFVVFEYTLQADGARDLDDLHRVFARGGTETKLTVLQPLTADDIVRGAGIRLDADTTMELYGNFDGNLRRVQDFVLVRSESMHIAGAVNPSTLLNATEELIRALPLPAQIVLALVVAHRSDVSHEALRSLYLYHPQFKDLHVSVDHALRNLEAGELIASAKGRVRLAHDSIAAEVARMFEVHLAMANRAWAAYYRDKLETADFVESSKDQVLDFLFSFYVRTDPAKLQPLLGEIRFAALSSFTLQRAAMLLDRVEESLAGFDESLAYQQAVRWELVEIYYAAGLYDRALETIRRINTKPMRRTAMLAAILDRVDRHDDAIRLIKGTLSTRPPRHDSFELSLRLIEMICYRSLNDYAGVRRVYDVIARTPEYRDLPEYAYYLRNAEIVLPVADSIPLLEESVARLSGAGNPAGEAQSRITLAMESIRIGRLDAADAQLMRAEELLAERRLDWHVVYNNRAVLAMYRGEAVLDAVDGLLRKAYLTANIPFDRIAIDNNRLAAHAIANDRAFCESILEELEQAASDDAEDVLRCITLFNISVYHGMTGNAAAQMRYLARARECRNDWPAYWAYRFDRVPIVDDEAAAYLASYPFDLVLLSAWHIDISDFGERFEATDPS